MSLIVAKDLSVDVLRARLRPGRKLPMAPKRTLDITTSTIAVRGLRPAATQDTPDFAKKPPLAAPLRLARNFTFLNDKPLFQVITAVSNTMGAVMTWRPSRRG